MSNFDQFISRHGEFGVQAIVERLERYDGIRSNVVVPLEERWNYLMQSSPADHQIAA